MRRATRVLLRRVATIVGLVGLCFAVQAIAVRWLSAEDPAMLFDRTHDMVRVGVGVLAVFLLRFVTYFVVPPFAAFSITRAILSWREEPLA